MKTETETAPEDQKRQIRLNRSIIWRIRAQAAANQMNPNDYLAKLLTAAENKATQPKRGEINAVLTYHD
jgi:predicted DNA binding CopG/RHH family protein